MELNKTFEWLMLKKISDPIISQSYDPILTIDNYISLVNFLRTAEKGEDINFFTVGRGIEYLLREPTSFFLSAPTMMNIIKNLKTYVDWFMKSEVDITLLEMGDLLLRRLGNNPSFDSNIKQLEAMKDLNITHLAIVNSNDYRYDTDATSLINKRDEYSQLYGEGSRYTVSTYKEEAYYKDAMWSLQIHDTIVHPINNTTNGFRANYVMLASSDTSNMALYGRRILTIPSPYMLPTEEIRDILGSKLFPKKEEINKFLNDFKKEHSIEDPVKRKK